MMERTVKKKRKRMILSCGGPYDVNKGSDIIMECDVKGDPFPEVTWTAPGGTVADVSSPGRFVSTRRNVNTSVVTAADFVLHHGLWNVSATSSQGSVSALLTVNVLTTTTTTTTILKTTPQKSKTSATSVSTDTTTTTTISPNIWFYLALAAFGITALALIALILVATFKIRKNQRQVGQDPESALGPLQTLISHFSHTGLQTSNSSCRLSYHLVIWDPSSEQNGCAAT